ncbi:MAG: BrnT family toxin [Halochromatium sp.]|uniref:BrnT family toxin n=1 Tax=Halochromatium sp. TaxID=2049430 RepID=UPI00397A89AB
MVWEKWFEWETALLWTDTREDYGEERQCGIGYIGLRLFVVVFVDRSEGRRRIISLRKATRTEVDRYAKS